MKIDIRELPRRIEELISLASQGEQVIVMDGGLPRFTMTPIPPSAVQDHRSPPTAGPDFDALPITDRRFVRDPIPQPWLAMMFILSMTALGGTIGYFSSPWLFGDTFVGGTVAPMIAFLGGITGWLVAYLLARAAGGMDDWPWRRGT